MEVFTHRRSKSASSSTGLPHPTSTSTAQGSRQIYKQKSFTRPASDSSSCSSGTTEDNEFTLELGWRSSKQVVRTPIKKLLAEEMSRETESKRKAPGLVARLMGLDGMPPPQPAHKQQVMSLENYRPRVASVDKTQRSGSLSGRRSFRKSSKDELEFKDVFEVLETSKPGSSSSPFRESANSKLTEAEMAFIKQKFMDAKCLSIDEKLQDSKQFHHAVEVLDSNKDLLLRFLQQPDSLFTKHLCDLHSTPQIHCGHLAPVRSSDSPKRDGSSLGSKDREVARKNHSKYPQKHCDRLSSNPCSVHVSHNSLISSQVQLEVRREPAITPTRIVVLKPNIGKIENASKEVQSHHFSHAFPFDSREHTEVPGMKNSETELLGKRNFPGDMGRSRYNSRESRDIAREITRQMRNNFNMGSPKFRGYAGDESSCSLSRNESMYDSEASAVTSRNSFDWTNRNQASSSQATESSVSREAKKRLSERWKMTRKSQEVGGTSRGNTLGEMLAIPDREAGPAKVGPVNIVEKISDKFARDDRPSGWVEPLGISSRDGWKDGCITNLSRSRSSPASSAAIESPKTRIHCETVCVDRYSLRKEALKQENKLVKRNYDQREILRPRSARSKNRRSHSSRCGSRDGDTSTETNCSQNQLEIKLEEKDPFVQDLAISVDTSSVLEDDVDVSQNNSATSFRSPDLDSPAHLVVTCNSPVDANNPIPQALLKEPSEEATVPLHHPAPDLESPASSKEGDQPSPLSVLEAPFIDDPLSGSECFESLSADLNGLRMQLELLKLGSETYEEGMMVVSSDEEDVEEEPVGVSKVERSCSSTCWESSYIHNVLTESGFSNTDSDMLLTRCHSADCPVSPSVFEGLEKEYSDQAPCLRAERKLLFDRINAGLAEINRNDKPCKGSVESRLYKVLEEKAIDVESVLGKERQWVVLGDEMRIVGREVERMLMNEIVVELVMDM